LVELMGGEISVFSQPGQGSQFTIELPLQLASEHTAPVDPTDQELRPKRQTPSHTHASASAQLVLLAEDDETNRDVMLEQLRLLGYSADVANDGRAALAMWRSKPYALLLTDCHMPGLDGFALASTIRKEEPAGTRMPIIAVTANALKGEAERCIDSGMDDFLTKPLRLNKLAPVLNKWLPNPASTQSDRSVP
jgi:CheY-like chemotaxis protein